MRLRRFSSLLPVAGLIAALALTSCGGSRTEERTEATQASSDAGVTVSKVEIGKSVDTDMRITEQTRSFGPTETVYAAVITNGAAPSAEITTRWTFEDGQVVDENTQTITPNGNASTEFHISKPDGLPPGKYKVEVFLNGTPAGTEEFEVKANP